jgi:hypothetical protein
VCYPGVSVPREGRGLTNALLDVADLAEVIMKTTPALLLAVSIPWRAASAAVTKSPPPGPGHRNPFRWRFSSGRKRDCQREDNNAAKHQPLHVPFPLRAPRQAMRFVAEAS